VVAAVIGLHRQTRKVKILVVDDHDDTRELVRRTLQGAGYSVRSASDGRQALGLILDHSTPDLIILDMMMPVMGGADLIEVLACYQRLVAIPLLIISGHPPSSMRRPHWRYLQKPFELAELEEKVEELLRRQ
jgi:two-component system phosphate regulon response regulator PhoB